MKNYPGRPSLFCVNGIFRCMELNNSEFHDIVKSLFANNKMSEIIRLELKEGWQDFAARTYVQEKGEIIINECFLSFLWCSSYYTSLIYNYFLVPLQSKTEVNEGKIEIAYEALDYGMSLKYGYDTWPDNIPHPREIDKDVELANIIWCIAANFIISHEIAHIYHKHQECIGEQSYRQEYEADNTAFHWLDRERVKTDEFAYQMGIFVALFTTFMMNLHPEKGGDKHPSSFSRFQRILNKFEIDDEHQIWALSLMVFAVWNSRFNKNIEFYPNEGKSYKEKFYDLLEMLMPENK